MRRVEPAGADTFGDDAPERPEHVADVAKRGRIDVRRPLRDLAQPDRGKVRARLRFTGDRGDVGADLVLGGGVGRRDRDDPGADGAEHVAQDLAIERGLAGEVVVDHRLVQPGGARDAVDVGAGVAFGGELAGGGREDAVARDGGARFGWPGHELTNWIVNYMPGVCQIGTGGSPAAPTEAATAGHTPPGSPAAACRRAGSPSGCLWRRAPPWRSDRCSG